MEQLIERALHLACRLFEPVVLGAGFALIALAMDYLDMPKQIMEHRFGTINAPLPVVSVSLNCALTYREVSEC